MSGQRHRQAIEGYLLATGVEGDGAEGHSVVRSSAGAAQYRAQACQQLFHSKGFGQVIVGPGVDALDLLVPTVTRRQNQNRNCEPLGTPGTKHRQAVAPRQAEVQHHSVIGFGLAEELGFFTVRSAIHCVARRLESASQLPRQARIVFDHQHPHH